MRLQVFFAVFVWVTRAEVSHHEYSEDAAETCNDESCIGTGRLALELICALGFIERESLNLVDGEYALLLRFDCILLEVTVTLHQH